MANKVVKVVGDEHTVTKASTDLEFNGRKGAG